MPNMSYCRFENTYPDLADCAAALHEVDGDLSSLSDTEQKHAERLIQLCCEVAENFGSVALAGRFEQAV